MRILVIGGGVFLGAALLDSALARGHAVTVFNRGRARSKWPDGVEVVIGDRMHDLARVAGRRFDAVVDTCGYVPADLRTSSKALDDVGRYCFVSSVSAYASFARAPVQEDDALAQSAGLAADDRDRSHYGAQKAACERVVEAAFGARALIVRPGLIVGPGDPTGRLSHWPWRALAGGEMLVPDVAADEPIQWIDVRDLPTDRARSRTMRAASTTRPASARRLTGWPALLETRIEAARRRRAAGADRSGREMFLRAQGVAP
jgi:2'-hydroxyisoflavone reductase